MPCSVSASSGLLDKLSLLRTAAWKQHNKCAQQLKMRLCLLLCYKPHRCARTGICTWLYFWHLRVWLWSSRILLPCASWNIIFSIQLLPLMYMHTAHCPQLLVNNINTARMADSIVHCILSLHLQLNAYLLYYNFCRVGNPNMPHGTAWFRRLERSKATIRFWNAQVFRDVCIWPWLR